MKKVFVQINENTFKLMELDVSNASGMGSPLNTQKMLRDIAEELYQWGTKDLVGELLAIYSKYPPEQLVQLWKEFTASGDDEEA